VFFFGVLGTILLIIFVQVERNANAPLMPLGIVTKRAVTVPNLAVMLLSVIGVSQLFVMTLYFQEFLERTALETGFLFVPMTLSSVVASPLAGRLTTRFGTRRITALGFVLLATGLIIVASRIDGDDTLVALLFGMAVAEAGFMTASVPLTVAATGAMGTSRSGLASGILSTSREVGNAFGWVAVAAIIAAVTATPGGAVSQSLIGGLRWSLIMAVVVAGLALLAVLTLTPTKTPANASG
jgi:MFS family permease